MKNIFIKMMAGILYVAMVSVNFLANSLPINNRSTGEISDAYPNLFAPASFTFSIWGLIYLLLAGYVIYQFTKNDGTQESLFKRINFFFIITSLANIAWIFSWHYDYIGLSVMIMLVLLVSLIKITEIIPDNKLRLKEKFFISIPFAVYFGWITVATIANITVFLVSIGWNEFGVADSIWTTVILIVGSLIGVWRMSKDKSIVYGLVFVWAYLGILFKHLSLDGFSGQYPIIINTLIFCLLFLIFSIGRIIYKNKFVKNFKSIDK